MLTVFGSINLDISARVPRLAAPGETILGSELVVSPGGKGANQAHAAGLFGSPVALFGAVGGDALAAPALRSLVQSRVDVSGVRTLEDAATGVACISVTPSGENAIVVAPGANARVQADWVDDASLKSSRALLLQLEVPADQSMAVARRAKAAGCPVILNAAPAQDLEQIDPVLIDWLVVNETELAQLITALGLQGDTPREQAAALARDWSANVVLTRGAKGALLCTLNGRGCACGAWPGPVVDTTGAGDTFTGVLAALIAAQASPEQALHWASVAAGLACGRPGAQAAQPSRAQIDAAMRLYVPSPA